jgi:hypothetical protein
MIVLLGLINMIVVSKTLSWKYQFLSCCDSQRIPSDTREGEEELRQGIPSSISLK